MVWGNIKSGASKTWGGIERGAKATGRGIERGIEWIGGKLDRADTGFREVDPTGQLGDLAGQGVSGFGQTGQRMGGLADMLEARAQGQDSLSAEQLRQNLGRALSQQQSMAAGASPANQAMAARTAARTMGQQAAGLSGQQALAGIQERAVAQGQLQGLLGQQRQQDLQAALGGMGTIEGARTARHQIGAGQPTDWERAISLAKDVGTTAASAMGGGGSAGAGGAGGAMTSDREAKTGIRSGSEDAQALIEALAPMAFRYREPERNGSGERLGVMAQDVEKAAPGIVTENGRGEKQIDTGGLMGALAAAVGELGQKVDEMERGSERREPRAAGRGSFSVEKRSPGSRYPNPRPEERPARGGLMFPVFEDRRPGGESSTTRHLKRTGQYPPEGQGPLVGDMVRPYDARERLRNAIVSRSGPGMRSR